MSVLTGLGAAAAAAALAVGAVTGSTLLSAGPAAADGGQWGPRLTQACGRVPHRIERAEKLRTRFHADAGTKGSIAFLQARIDKATAEGHADVARLLTDRLAVRRLIDASLPDVLARLEDARQVCAKHPSATPSATPSGSSS